MENIETIYLLSVGEACACLGIRRTKLFQLIRDGELPFVKIGRRTLIPQRGIVGLIQRNTRIGGQ